MNRRSFVKGLLGVSAGAFGLNKILARKPRATRTAAAYIGRIEGFGAAGEAGTGTLCNCLLMPKKDQDGPMFTVTEDKRGTIIPNLDGYAIVPFEELRDSSAKRYLQARYKIG